MRERFVRSFMYRVMLKIVLFLLMLFNISEPFEDELKKLSD